MLDVAPLVLVALLLLATPVLAILAFVRASRLRRRVAELEVLVAKLARAAATPETAPEAASAARSAPEPLEAPQAAPPPEPAAVAATAAEKAGAAPDARPSLETRLAERWLVWLGAGAVGLGGLFAAGYAVEAGLLGPAVRVMLVALLGLALVALGLRLRSGARAGGRADHVPAALAAGGLVALYGAAAAAYALYGLIEPPVAFLLLALVAMLGVSLGLLFGGLVGILGALGAYLVPAIVGSGHPSAWALFPYLAVVAASLAVLAGRAGWPWLGWLNLAGALIWPLLWLVGRAGPGDAVPMAGYALVIGLAGMAALLLPHRLDDGTAPSPAARQPGRALVGAALLLVVLVLATLGFTAAPLAALAFLSLSCLGTGLLRPEERWLAGMAAAADLLAAACWQIPAEALMQGAPGTLERALDPLLWVAPAAAPLARALLVIGAFWAAAGSLVAWRAPRPGFWAGLAVAVSLAALGLGYWRLAGFALNPPLAWTALALAAFDLVLAERAARRPALRAALAAYAVGVVGALALGAAIVLAAGWLTLVLAAELPAMGWVALRLDLPELRRPARWLAAIVLARAGLGLDPDLLDTGRGLVAALVSCGGPMLLMALASLLFRRQREDGLTALLDGGALLFWLLLVFRLTRELLGDPQALVPALLESSAQAVAWLATGLALLWQHRREPGRLIPRLGWPLLLALGALQTLLVNLGALNPVITGAPVGTLPILNLLLPAYGLPALLAWPIARAMPRRDLAVVAGGLGLLLALAWLTLEIRHLFQGPVMTGATSEGEWLSYSAGWLAFAGLLLAQGIHRGDRMLRAAALVVAGVAVLKAFLFDLGELEGLYRAASFLGLGLCLIGIGWLYRRFVGAPPAEAAS